MPSKKKSKFSIETEVIGRLNNLKEKLMKVVFNIEKKEEAKPVIEKEIIEKINSLKEKELNEKIVVELNAILKDYLKIKLGLVQSLTYEEIIEKLEDKRLNKETKINLFHLLVQINQKEYFPHSEMSSTEVDFLLKLAIKTMEGIEESERIENEAEKKVENNNVIVNSNEPIRIIKLKEDIAPFIKRSEIDWRNEETRKGYEKIREDYLKLEDDEKLEVYPQIISILKMNKPVIAS